MRWVVIGVVLLLVAALGALVAAPHVVDPARVRDAAESALRRATGRAFVIAGPTTLSLLPIPTVTARDVHLTNPPGAAEKDLLQIAAVELRLAIAPLFGLHFALERLTLANPVLDLERLPDGTMNWRAPSAESPDAASVPDPEKSATAQTGSRPSVALLHIADGTVVVHAAGRTERISRLDLTASALTSTGPVRASGTLRALGVDLELSLEAGAVAERMPLRLNVALRGGAMRAELAGDILAPPRDAPSIVGKVKLGGGDFASLLARFGRPVPASLARPFTAASDLTATAEDLRFDDLTVTLDDMRGAGVLRVTPATPPRASLTLSFSQVDLDRLAAVDPAAASILPANPPQQSGGDAVVRASPSGFTLPADLRATVDLSLGALTWRGSILREARLQAALDHGAITLGRSTALLPGGSDFSLNGVLTTPAAAPRFVGAIETDSDNVRQLLDWLGLPTGQVPADRLRKASLATHFTATPDHLEIDDFDLTVDATRVTGAASVALRQRIAFGARLAVDRLNLDAYLPRPVVDKGGAAAPSNSQGAPSAQGSRAAPRAAGSLLDRFDANLEATIETLTVQGQPARGVHLAGTLQQGELAVREVAIADLAGASATISGVLAGVGGDNPRWQASVVANGAEVEPVFRLLSPGFDSSGRLSGGFTVRADVQGERGAATALDVTLEALGGAARITGGHRDDAGGRARFDLALDVSHPSFARFARALVPGYQPAGGDPGAVALTGTLRGTSERATLGEAALAIGALRVEGEATLDRTGDRPKLTGALSFGDLVVDAFLPARQAAARGLDPAAAAPRLWLAQASAAAPRAARWSGEAIDLSALGTVDADVTLTGNSLTYGGWRLVQPASAVTLTNSVLEIGRLSGGLFGGALEANGRLEAGGQRRATATVALRRAVLKEALETIVGAGGVDGRGDLDAILATAGRSPAELVGRLAGTIRLVARDGTISGVDLAAVSARLKQVDHPTDLLELSRGLSGGATQYETLDGTFRAENGVLASDDLRLVATGAEGRANVTADLPGWRVRSRIEFRLINSPVVPPIAMTLDGPLDGPRVIFDINALGAYLAGRAVKSPAP